jgi:exodeoxyribonuclease VIII
MNNEEYHAHPAISKSHLDLIARSPMHYWARYVDPNRVAPEATAAMLLGSAVHTYVLELDTWDSRYVTMPEGIDRRTKAGKESFAAFQEFAGDRITISRDDTDLVIKMSSAIYSHPAASMLLNLPGKAETTYMWFDDVTGLHCKCRPDWISNDGSILVDIKTTEDASLNEFRRSIAKFNYHNQAAWYLNGVEQATGKRPDQFLFICVEKRHPHCVAVYAADAAMITAGEIATRNALNTLSICRAADHWPGYSDQIQQISLPPWMLPKSDGTLSTTIEMY